MCANIYIYNIFIQLYFVYLDIVCCYGTTRPPLKWMALDYIFQNMDAQKNKTINPSYGSASYIYS